MGVAVYHVNPGICVYKNSSLTKSNLPGAAGAWEDTTHSTGWYELTDPTTNTTTGGTTEGGTTGGTTGGNG